MVDHNRRIQGAALGIVLVIVLTAALFAYIRQEQVSEAQRCKAGQVIVFISGRYVCLDEAKP